MAKDSTNAVKQKSSRFFLTYFIIILTLIAAGRAVSYLCTLSSTNIAFPEWVESVTSYLSEILDAARRAVSYCAIVCAAFCGFGVRTTVSVSLLTLLDFAARLVIDLVTSAVSGTEVVALIWLGANFLYELVFLILACIVSRIVKLKLNAEENERKKCRHTPEKALLYSVGLYCASRLVSEIFYLVDFLLSYVNITNTEIASIVGSFLEILAVYGGISYIVGYAVLPLFLKAQNVGADAFTAQNSK